MKKLAYYILPLLIFSITFFIPQVTFSINRDSLRVIWTDHNQPDTIRLKSLDRFCWSMIMNTNSDSLYTLGQTLLDLAIKLDNKKKQTNAYHFMGIAQGRSLNYEKAIQLFNQCIQLSEQIGYKRKIAWVNNHIGTTYLLMYNYPQAQIHFHKADSIHKEVGYRKGAASYHLYQCLMYLSQGNYPEARSHIQKSIDILDEVGEGNTSGRGWRLGNLATVLAEQGNYQQALDVAFQAKEIYSVKIDTISQAGNYNSIGRIYTYQGNYPEALEYFNKSLAIWEHVELHGAMAGSIVNIANVYIEQGKYKEALEQINKSLDLVEDVPEYRLVKAECFERIGFIYNQLEHYQSSLDFYRQSLDIYRDVNSRGKVAELYDYIGQVYNNLHNSSLALEYYLKSLVINKEIGVVSEEAGNYMNIGKTIEQQNDLNSALEYYEMSKTIYEDIGDKKGMAETYLNIGQLKLKEDDVHSARKWCEDGYRLVKELGTLKLEKEACDCLYKVNKQLGNGALALAYYERCNILQDSLKNDEAYKQLQQMEFDRQRLEDSLTRVEENLKSELAFQEELIQEKNTRNTFMFAGLGVLLIAGGLFSRMLYIRRTNKELEKKNRIIAREKERAEESERAKEQFFDNVSHEFRTPLTLILGPLDEALEKTTDNTVKPNLEIMQRNAMRLEGMINELLDLSKLEFGKVKLKAKEENIVKLTGEFLQSFESLADQKKIKLSFKSQAKEYLIWIDSDQMKKILANLLSNAFKFTEEGGEINVSMGQPSLKLRQAEQSAGSERSGASQPNDSERRDTNDQTRPYGSPSTNDPAFALLRTGRQSPMTNDQLPVANRRATKPGIEIKVSDTGIGIPTTKLPHIFDRFYQVGESSHSHQTGTGIGLALTKELIELHHGNIQVVSKPGKGTTFTIFIPFGKEHLESDEIVEEAVLTPVVAKEQGETENNAAIDLGEHQELPVILIVEDNPDMRTYISSHMEKEYTILEAKDGEDGLQQAYENIPDLIISDVMMPGMDGCEMTEKLKTDQRTSHIPIIILTARASVESRIEGLETGADAYVTKPFTAKELQVRIRKLIEQRQKLRELYAGKLEKGIETEDGAGLISMEEQFLQKAMKVVNEHISDENFDSNVFAGEMALSRVQLHRKIKALTNKTTNEFIRTIRLNKAAELLKLHSDNITQIAYETGFSSLSWFAKVFKEQFGVSPSEYAD